MAFKAPQKENYVTQFLSLKCSGDVLNAVAPINNAEKEITESMAVIQKLRKVAIKDPMKYALYDLGAGNALTSVIAAHLLPFKYVVAVDKVPRNRRYHEVKRFFYEKAEFLPQTPLPIKDEVPIIICAVHPCRNLAHSIVDIYISTPQVRGLVLMPCCQGPRKNHIPHGIEQKIGSYLSWTYDLSISAKGTFDIDTKCLSPCNAIVTANKDN